MAEGNSSDELEEVVINESGLSKHKRGFSEGKAKAENRRYSRSGSREDDAIDGRPLLEHAISEPPLRSQVFRRLS